MKLTTFFVNILLASSALGFQPLEPINSESHPTKLVWDLGHEFLTNINEIESKNLTSGKSKIEPWSGDYWMAASAGIAYRYADPYLQMTVIEKDYSNAPKQLRKISKYLEKRPLQTYINSGRINELSPSEKYDLLVGDKNQTLTRSVLASSHSIHSVDFWEGVCDGWSAASVFEKRPINPVSVTAVNGERITFYPDDLKALMTLFWSESNYEYNIIGSDCDGRRRAGRIAEGGCYNKLNAASWHLMVVNQIGQNKMPFIFDDDSSYQVWNFPLQSYKFKYYNLVTGEQFDDLKTDNDKNGIPDVLIEKSSVRDRFEKYRAQDSKYLLGITMEATYPIEVNASVKPRPDKHRKMSLFYDLEINSDFEIVGGEWYDDNHPDFAWMPSQGTKAQLEIERTLGLSWDGKSPISRASQIAARGGELSGKSIPSQSEKLLPLPHIFKALVELSR